MRERHALPGGDLARAENQRNVIKAIVQKGLSGSTLADPMKSLAFVSGLASHVTVDSQLTNAEIRSTVLSLKLTGKDIDTLQAPVSGFGTTPAGQSIDLVDTAKLKTLSTALREDKMSSYVQKHPES